MPRYLAAGRVQRLAEDMAKATESNTIALEMRLAEGSSSHVHALEFTKSEVIIGRSENSDIQLPDSSVSIVHAKIQLVDSSRKQWSLQDLQSTNGTALDGKRLDASTILPIHIGSMIHIGRFCLKRISPNPKKRPSKYESTASLARALMRDMAEKIAGAKKRIFIENSQRFPEAIIVEKKQSLILGRDGGCDISIDDPDLSRKHIQLEDVKDGLRISDLSSKNGTYVNGEKISLPQLLIHDDRVKIGNTELRFAEANQELLEELQQPLRYTSYALDDHLPTSAENSTIDSPVLDKLPSSEKKEAGEGVDWLFFIPALILVASAVATVIYLAR